MYKVLILLGLLFCVLFALWLISYIFNKRKQKSNLASRDATIVSIEDVEKGYYSMVRHRNGDFSMAGIKKKIKFSFTDGATVELLLTNHDAKGLFIGKQGVLRTSADSFVSFK